MTLLNNAPSQTGWTGDRLTDENWRGVVRQRIAALEWTGVARDVAPFIEAGVSANQLTLAAVTRLIDDTR